MKADKNNSFIRYLLRSYRKNVLESMGILGAFIAFGVIISGVLGELPSRSPLMIAEATGAIVLMVLFGGIVLALPMSFSRWLRDRSETTMDIADRLMDDANDHA
jgi:uncharacterized membrane protein YraQ (UPF0718 family)